MPTSEMQGEDGKYAQIQNEKHCPEREKPEKVHPPPVLVIPDHLACDTPGSLFCMGSGEHSSRTPRVCCEDQGLHKQVHTRIATADQGLEGKGYLGGAWQLVLDGCPSRLGKHDLAPMGGPPKGLGELDPTPKVVHVHLPQAL